jgi:DeoR family fructose operon transcriptional repressor
MSEPGRSRAPFSDQRKQAILQQLGAAGRVEVTGLAERLGVSGESIRKDLVQLESQGLLRRVHGGAVPVQELSFEPAVSVRTSMAPEKAAIARAALAHVPPGGSILLDAGSTTAELAHVLPADRELTVYTNALPIALTLVARPLIAVHTLGGRLRPRTVAEVDHITARTLASINVDVAFLGTNALSFTRGLTTPDEAEAAVKRLMLGAAERRVFLVDHTKFGRKSLCQHAELSDIDLLITDSGVEDSHVEALAAADVPLQVV